MANKKYRVVQKVTVNGATKYASMSIVCENTELDAIKDLLEGEITVYEQVGDPVGSATQNVIDYNLLSRVSLSDGAETKKTFFASNPLILKNTKNVDEVAAAFGATHPFLTKPAEKPARVTPVVLPGNGGVFDNTQNNG